MKILAIRIKNLASLEGENEIDFTVEPLKSEGIFAITGPTGSGKSTILDALCLALFANTPRHENGNSIRIQDIGNVSISQSDIRGILSKGCGDGYAEVHFIGVDNNEHKSKWTVRRAHNNINQPLQADTLKLTNITTNTVFPDTRKTVILKELERLVGLNFVQFTRSVLLAQGEFTAFLKANDEHKSSLLEKLTGTDIYSEISKRIYEKFKESDFEYKQLHIQMQGIELLTAEEIIVFEEQKKNLSEKFLLQEAELLKVVDDMNWHVALINLTGYTIDAKAILDLCIEEKAEAQERTNKFNLVVAVQPAREMLTTKNNLNTELANTTTEINTLQLSIDAWNTDNLNATISLTTASDNLLKNEAVLQQAAPLIAEAKVLDTKIEQKTEQVIQAENEANAATKNKQVHELILENKHLEIKSTSALIDNYKQWKDANEARKPIAENQSIINSKLVDAGILLIQKLAIESDLNDTQQKLETGNKTLANFNVEVDTIKVSLEKLIEENVNNESGISAVAIEDIKATENLLRHQINEMVPATACWELLYTNQQEVSLIEQKLKVNQEEIQKKKEKSAEQNIKLGQADELQKLTEKILNEAILQTQKSVKDMRAQLLPSTPCPVCGSNDHPFTSSDPALKNVIESLKIENATSKDSYKEILILCNTLQTEINSIENNCTILEKELAIKNSYVQNQTIKWDGFEMNETCLSIPAIDRLSWLRAEENKLKKELQGFEQNIMAYQLLKDKTAHQKNEINNAENILLNTQSLFKDCEKDLQFLLVENKRLLGELDNCNGNITAITTQLNTNFTDKDWQSNWQKNPAGFIKKINEFASDWSEKIAALQVADANLLNLQTELNGLNQQLQFLNNAASFAIKKHCDFEVEFLKIKQERNQLFNGEPITKVEQRFLQQIESDRIIVKNCAEEKESITTRLIKANSNKEQYEKVQVKLSNELVSINSKINNWLLEFNVNNQSILDEAVLLSLLAYSANWITEERNSLWVIDEAITKATATLTDRNLALTRHSTQNVPSDPADVLKLRHAEVKELMEGIRTESSAISNKLLLHTNKVLESENLLIDIKKKKLIYENWFKLNDLIGSADGKKFRQFAQEYTLDILLGFANIHLEEFSTRYKLSRIPNTLSLQVLDKDMGDEIRSVNTLSGGESFLVSLALALGLASLSSNKMKVESLFIDEGFGSLDPATLSIAMDALCKLKDQGRKVGVISHVAEMTENITTQIRITKISNGRSKLEVI